MKRSARGEVMPLAGQRVRVRAGKRPHPGVASARAGGLAYTR